MDEGFEEEGPILPWLPPDDRLWRHPSEVAGSNLTGPDLAASGLATATGGTLLATRPQRGPEMKVWAVAIVAGLVGASLTAGLSMATGRYRPLVVVHPVERVVHAAATLTNSSVPTSALALALSVKRSIVRLDVTTRTGHAIGSGVIARSDGSVITDDRLVAHALSLQVVLPDGRSVPGRVIGGDPTTDIAVVRYSGATAGTTSIGDLAGPGDATGQGHTTGQGGTAPGRSSATVATLGSVTTLQPGEMTFIVGYSNVGSDVSTAVIRTTEGAAHDRYADSGSLLGLIETDVEVPGQASGGPLVDSTGAVVGITTSVGSGSKGAFAGYAVPIDTALSVAHQIMTTGHVSHGWLGVVGQALTSSSAHHLGISEGVLVRTVIAHSPAARAGLVRGDVITFMDNSAVSSMNDLIGELRRLAPKDTVMLTLLRHTRALNAEAVLGERPASERPAAERPAAERPAAKSR